MVPSHLIHTTVSVQVTLNSKLKCSDDIAVVCLLPAASEDSTWKPGLKLSGFLSYGWTCRPHDAQIDVSVPAKNLVCRWGCGQAASGFSSGGRKIPITLRGWPGSAASLSTWPCKADQPANAKCAPCWPEGSKVSLRQPFDSWGKNSGVQRSGVTPDGEGSRGCLH